MLARAKIRDFWRGDQGNIALVFAIVFPALALVGVGAIQLNGILTFKQMTAGVADAAALFGAEQLNVTSTGAADRTQAFALAQMQHLGYGKVASVSVTSPDAQTVRVEIDGTVESFFGNMLPAGGFKTQAVSVAQSVNNAPLCVLVFGTKNNSYFVTKNQNLQIGGSGSLTAGSCAVYSDQDITVGGGQASLAAETVEAVGQAHGQITPTASTGAPYVADPFASLDVSLPTTCLSGVGNEVITSNTTLPPGLHCNNITVENGAVLTLASGNHYFSGNLQLQDTSTLVGDDVVLDFDRKSKFDFNGTSSVSLNGRKSGNLAGFVIVCDRSNNHAFTIESDHVSQLVGTVYIPSAQLVVNGTNKVAQSSPWTVVVAQAINVSGQSNLVINSDYSTSTVPVPAGVGPNNRGARLVQ